MNNNCMYSIFSEGLKGSFSVVFSCGEVATVNKIPYRCPRCTKNTEQRLNVDLVIDQVVLEGLLGKISEIDEAVNTMHTSLGREEGESLYKYVGRVRSYQDSLFKLRDRVVTASDEIVSRMKDAGFFDYYCQNNPTVGF